MLTWLHANLAGLLRAFVLLKWKVTLQGAESFIKRTFFQTYLAPKPFLQEHPLGLMCPRAHFGNYCRSHGESLKAFKQSQGIYLVFGKTVGWTGGVKTETEKALNRLLQKRSRAPCQPGPVPATISARSELAVRREAPPGTLLQGSWR